MMILALQICHAIVKRRLVQCSLLEKTVCFYVGPHEYINAFQF